MTTTTSTGVTFVHAAQLLATHLADHQLPEPASLQVTTRAGQSQVRAQVHALTVPRVAAELLAWADTLTTLADHRADRKAFVAQALAALGIDKPAQDTSRLIWRKVAPGDQNVPPRAHLLMHAIAERIRWRAEYDRAMSAATGRPPGDETSATQPIAA